MSGPQDSIPKDSESQKSGQTAEKICIYCKRPNKSDFTFCAFCGNRLNSKICPNCRITLPIDAKYCANCGINLETTAVQSQNFPNPQPQPGYYSPFPQYSQQPQNPQNSQYPQYPQPQYPQYPPYPNYPYTYYPVNQNYNFYFEKPKWWNLPVFYIIFCMFGLLIVSSLVVVITLIFLGLRNTNLSLTETIYIDVFTKMFQLFLIVIAIFYFKGLKGFFSNGPKYTGPPKVSEEIKEPQTKPTNLIIKVMFVLLLVFILLVVDLYTNLIVAFIEEFFNLNTTSSSSYSFLDSSLTQDFLIIFLWACVFAPIHEEILFRGILQQALNKSGTSDFSHYIIQGTTFAFMHLAGDILNGGSPDFVLLHMVSTFLFGVSSTYLRKKFNSLIPSILLHSLSNTLSLSFSFVTTPYFTTDQVNMISIAIYIVPILLIIILLAILYLSGHWKIKKPLSFEQEKARKFIFAILGLALIFNISQYLYIILPLSQQLTYLIVITLASIVVYFLWGSKVKDVPFNQVVIE